LADAMGVSPSAARTWTKAVNTGLDSLAAASRRRQRRRCEILPRPRRRARSPTSRVPTRLLVCLLMSQNVVASLPRCLRIDPAAARNSSSDLQPGHNVIVYLRQQPQPIPLFFSLWPVKLCAVPCQRTLERDRDCQYRGRQKSPAGCIVRAVEAKNRNSGVKSSISSISLTMGISVVCGSCGHESPAGTWFCGVCGIALPHRPLNPPGAQGTMGFVRRPLENPRAEERVPAAAADPVLSITRGEKSPCSADLPLSGIGATEDAPHNCTEDPRERPLTQLNDVTTTGETPPLQPELLGPTAAVPPESILVAAPDFPWIDEVLEQVDLLAKSSEGKNPPQVPDFLEGSSLPAIGSDMPTATAITKSPQVPVMQVASGSDNQRRKERKEHGASGKWRMWLAVAASLLFAVLGAIQWTSQKRHISTEEQSKRHDDSAATNANSFASGANENSEASTTITASQGESQAATVGSSKAIVPQPAKQGAPPVTRRSDAGASQDADHEVVVKKVIPGNLEMNRAKNARDKSAEVTWLWKATAKGNPDAPIRLADLYIKGDVVPRNCKEAVDLLRTAAIKDNVRACNRLALMYAVGICVPSNRVQAYHWLSLALATDPSNEWSQRNRDLNWQQMTPEERTLAMKYRYH
jgi:Sel1 repeat